jgi:SAM-dependent methyltransferase
MYLSVCRSAQNVLEIGCGTGRILRALLPAKFRVTGVDISDEMLDLARTNLAAHLVRGALRLRKHDFRKSPLLEKFDRALVTFYTFNYLLTKFDQDRFLLNVQKSLAPNGILVLDLFYPLALAQPAAANQWTESVLESDGHAVALKQKRKMIGKIEERTQIYTEGANQEEIVTKRRFVSKREAVALLKQTGFMDIQVTNGYDGSGFRPLKDGEETNSTFVCIASKPA